jgi:hypothetical protein
MRVGMTVATIAIVAIGAVGCGGSTQTSSRAAQATPEAANAAASKTTPHAVRAPAAFRRRGDAICARASRALVSARGSKVVRYAQSLSAWQHSKITGMRTLEPSTALRPQFDQYLQALRARADLFDRYVATARNGMTPVHLQEDAMTLLHREISLAAQLGLGQSCNN